MPAQSSRPICVLKNTKILRKCTWNFMVTAHFLESYPFIRLHCCNIIAKEVGLNITALYV